MVNGPEITDVPAISEILLTERCYDNIFFVSPQFKFPESPGISRTFSMESFRPVPCQVRGYNRYKSILFYIHSPKLKDSPEQAGELLCRTTQGD